MKIKCLLCLNDFDSIEKYMCDCFVCRQYVFKNENLCGSCTFKKMLEDSRSINIGPSYL